MAYVVECIWLILGLDVVQATVPTCAGALSEPHANNCARVSRFFGPDSPSICDVLIWTDWQCPTPSTNVSSGQIGDAGVLRVREVA